MNKGIIKFLAKISTISISLVVLFNVGTAFFDNTTNKTPSKSENKNVYIKSNSVILGGAGVAISTNLGIRYKQRTNLPATIYKDVMSIGEIMSKKENADKNIITNNMIAVNAYLNLMKTDVVSLIRKSNDKSSMLDALIAQNAYRYQISSKSIKNLITQRGVLESSMKINNSKLISLKSKIDTDFSGFKQQKTLDNINNYLKIKKEYNYSRIYIIFINQFINQYSYLNNYNKVLINVLTQNKEAIIKDQTVTIPKYGVGLLKKLNLITTQ